MLKKIVSFIAAAALAVANVTFTVIATEDMILSVGFPCGYNYDIENKDNMTAGYLGAAKLVTESWCADGEYADPGFILNSGYGASLENYSALEVEYDCSNPDEIKYLSLAVQGGTASWHEIKESPSEIGKIVLDLSKKRDKTYDTLQFWAHPVDSYKLGDVFDPGITIKSAKLVAANEPFVQGIGETVLTPNEWSGDTYALPEYAIVESWTNPKSLMKYSSLVLEYECGNVGEIESLKLVVHGGTCEWNEIQAIPDESGKIILDLTDIRDKTFEAALLYVQPVSSYAIGDTFNPKIVITRAEFIADTDWIMSMEFTDKPVDLNVYEYLNGDKYAGSKSFLTEVNGIITWGEVKEDTFKLTGIEYRNDSLNGSSADFEICPCIRFQGGRIFTAMNIVTVDFQNQEAEWKLNDITHDADIIGSYHSGADHIIVEAVGYMINYVGDMSNVNNGDTIIFNPSGTDEIVNDEHNISLSPIDGSLEPDLILDVSENNVGNIEVKPEDKATVGKILLAYDIKLMSGAETVQPNCAIKISIPVPEGLNGSLLKVYHVQQDGTFTDMKAVYNPQSKTLTFVTNHLSIYAITGGDVLLGDVDGNGEFTIMDIVILANAYRNNNADQYLAAADTDGNGKITIMDIVKLCNIYRGK